MLCPAHMLGNAFTIRHWFLFTVALASHRLHSEPLLFRVCLCIRSGRLLGGRLCLYSAVILRAHGFGPKDLSRFPPLHSYGHGAHGLLC